MINKKRGQLTIFIIVAVVIVLSIVFYFFATSDVKKIYHPEIVSYKDDVMNCYEDLAERTIDYVSYQGGYYSAPQSSYLEDVYITPYYYEHGDIYVPSIKDIERELENAVDDNFEFCVFNRTNFIIAYDTPRTRVVIKNESIEFIIDLDISITHENKTSILELKDFDLNIPSNLMSIQSFSEFFINSINKTNEEWFEISRYDEFAEKNELYINVLDYANENNTQQVTIYSENIQDYPLAYRFVVNYNYEDLNLPISLTGNYNYEDLNLLLSQGVGK